MDSEEIKEALQLPELYTAWGLGYSHVGMWEDSVSMIRYVAEFRKDGMLFINEYGEEAKEEECAVKDALINKKDVESK